MTITIKYATGNAIETATITCVSVDICDIVNAAMTESNDLDLSRDIGEMRHHTVKPTATASRVIEYWQTCADLLAIAFNLHDGIDADTLFGLQDGVNGGEGFSEQIEQYIDILTAYRRENGLA